MKMFDKKGKMNFVDNNNCFVGFDYQSSCCEDFGYFFTLTEDGPVGEEGSVPESAIDESTIDLTNYNFDIQYAKQKGEMGIFRLVDDSVISKEIYLNLYNFHNGYYSHGFEMYENDKIILTGYL
jgi:hypothetical protein